MPRKAQLYLPLDVEFFDNERILAAGEAAGWLYLAMCCEAKRRMSDGFLTRRQIISLQVPRWQRRLDALIEHGLVMIADSDRWLVLGFLERNLSAEQIGKARQRDLQRKKFQSESANVPTGTDADSDWNLREVEVKRREVEVEARKETDEGTAEGPGLVAFRAARAGLRQASA